MCFTINLTWIKYRVDTAFHCISVFLLIMSSSSELSEDYVGKEAPWVAGWQNGGLSDFYNQSHTGT